MLLGYLGFIVLVFWFFADKKQVVEGQLNQVRVIKNNGLNGAKGLVLDRKGNIYVANSRNDQVVMITPGGRISRIFGEKKGEQGEELRYPTSVAIHEEYLLVGSYGTGKILVYNKRGDVVGVLPRKEDRQNITAIYPLAMTTDREGNLYVADGKKHRIAVFNSGGKLQLIFGEPGHLDGQLKHVNGLAVDEDNRQLIVLDAGNSRLVFYNLEGKFLKELIFQDKGEVTVIAGRGVAFNPHSGYIYITEAMQDKILALDQDGKILASSPNFGLKIPHGIAFGPDGYLYVTQREEGKISILNP
ncbi:MAG: 6-bladed beta-propeller [Thermincolia bacterium]